MDHRPDIPGRDLNVTIYGHRVNIIGWSLHGRDLEMHLDAFDLLFALDSTEPEGGGDNPPQDKPHQKRPKSDPGE